MGGGAAHGAEGKAGGIALVLTYKCEPRDRPAFREHLTGVTLPQLERWRAAGSFATQTLLFGLDVNEDAWDAMLLLEFANWKQYGAWKDIERTLPAALPPEGLRLVRTVSSALSELAWRGESGGKPATQRAVYFVRPYFYDDKVAYRRFFDAYNAPQLEAWLRVGAMRSYKVLLNQHPTGTTWGALFIYEYPSWEAAHARDDVKSVLAPELAALPAWELLGDLKGGIRRSGRVTLAERLDDAFVGEKKD